MKKKSKKRKTFKDIMNSTKTLLIIFSLLLVLVIFLLVLCVIKNKEADGDVQQERKIQKSIVEHMQQQCHCRRHKKRYQPKAVARAQRGAARDLGIDDQKRAPNHHEHQHGIGGKMHVGNIAGEEANDVALPEQRFAQKRLFQICHTLSYLRFP